MSLSLSPVGAALIYFFAGALTVSSVCWGKQQQQQQRYHSGDGIPVGGWGDYWTYEYLPDFLPLPPEANVEHAHGIAMEDDNEGTTSLVITYKDKTDPSRCLLRWRNASQYKNVPEFIGPGESLCRGVPHGLRADFDKSRNIDEEGKRRMVLYHANNEQSLHKTTMDGEILWTMQGKPDQKSDNNDNNSSYSPTWFAAHPDSPYVHLTDGYGSSQIYVFDKANGTYTGHAFGGMGSEHGKFQTCHAITWDWRWNQMVVSDRENHRLEYFTIDPADPSVFDYSHTISFDPMLKQPCNIRMRKQDGVAIVPFLEGSVGILDYENNLLSVINITAALGDEQYGFLHPHDAHFLPDDSGDFVLVTWNPGRTGYFRRIGVSRRGDNATATA